MFGRRGPNLAATLLSRHSEKHDLSETTFLVDQFGYRTAHFRLNLNGQVDYLDRNLIEKWHTSKFELAVSTVRGWAIGQVFVNDLD